jgi:hypothetical protein
MEILLSLMGEVQSDVSWSGATLEERPLTNLVNSVIIVRVEPACRIDSSIYWISQNGVAVSKTMKIYIRNNSVKILLNLLKLSPGKNLTNWFIQTARII